MMREVMVAMNTAAASNSVWKTTVIQGLTGGTGAPGRVSSVIHQPVMATDGSTASTERRRVRVAVEGTAMARVSSVISTETTVEETDSATWVSMNSDQQKHEPTIATA